MEASFLVFLNEFFPVQSIDELPYLTDLNVSSFSSSCLDRSILSSFCWCLLNSVCFKELKSGKGSQPALVLSLGSFSVNCLVCHLMLDIIERSVLNFVGVLVEVVLLFSAQSDSSSSFAEVTSSISTWSIACA